MSIRKVLFGLLLLGSSSVSAQDWSLGLDLISLGKVIGGEETPAVLQVRRSFNERHAVRVNLGAYHSHKRRDWDFLSTVSIISILNNRYDEINYSYSGRLGWEYSFLRREDRFRLYAYSGLVLDVMKEKRERNPLKFVIPNPSGTIPQDEVFKYSYQPEYDNHKSSAGIFLIPGVEVNITPRFSLAVESEVTGWWYKEYRYEQLAGWIFDWSDPGDISKLITEDGFSENETGFHLRFNAVQYLFIRYTF